MDDRTKITPEDKHLLLIDVSARFPYDVKVQIKATNCFDGINTLNLIDLNSFIKDRPRDEDWYDVVTSIKPYLRSLSSMTEEEAKNIAILHGNNHEDILSIKVTDEYIDIILDDGVCGTITSTIWYDEIISSVECLDYLNKKMFDYRGLIPKGLALEAPEGMYKYIDLYNNETNRNRYK